MSETPQPKASAPDLSGERALIVGEGDVPIAKAALNSMGLRERAHVSQVHADGEPIDSESRNRRVGWHQPSQEAVSGSSTGRLDDPGLPVDFEKAELSKRIGHIKGKVASTPEGETVEIHLNKIYPDSEPPAAAAPALPPEVASGERQLSGNIAPIPPLPPHFPGVNDVPVYESIVPQPKPGENIQPPRPTQ